MKREALAREAERIENPVDVESEEEEEVILPYARLNLGCHANISDRCFAAHARDNEGIRTNFSSLSFTSSLKAAGNFGPELFGIPHRRVLLGRAARMRTAATNERLDRSIPLSLHSHRKFGQYIRLSGRINFRRKS